MATALPAYLGNDFSNCPPGHRFGLYFEGWTDSFSLPKDGKTDAFRKVTGLPAHSQEALSALRTRQRAAAADLADDILVYPASLSAPLATGLGNEHPLENGFAFLNPHGLPYLAGSGVKGVLRRAAEELMSGEWGEHAGWDKATISVLFGLETDSGDNDSTRTRGALTFWDLFFQPPKGKAALAVEIMTPHHSGYLQGNGTPHANEQPTPIPFLAVPAGSECTLFVQCNPALIPADCAALRERWKSLLEAAIEHAGEWMGFGAKTAVGYGRLGLDPAAAAERAALREAELKAKALAEKQQRIDALPPGEALMAKVDDLLAKLPIDPRSGKPIFQPTSGTHWQPLLSLLDSLTASLATLAKAEREALASALKKRLIERFKIEGKAEKAMKERLAAVRGA